jgi:hypothetical protein
MSTRISQDSNRSIVNQNKALRPKHVDVAIMKKTLSSLNLKSKENTHGMMKKSHSMGSLCDSNEKEIQDNMKKSHSLDGLYNTTSTIIKANVPGLIYDITKDAVQHFHSNSSDVVNTISNDLKGIVMDNITQDTIISTVSHVVHHHL